jgi:hypothetical protein
MLLTTMSHRPQDSLCLLPSARVNPTLRHDEKTFEGIDRNRAFTRVASAFRKSRHPATRTAGIGEFQARHLDVLQRDSPQQVSRTLLAKAHSRSNELVQP